jgi:hypothetical protein
MLELHLEHGSSTSIRNIGELLRACTAAVRASGQTLRGKSVENSHESSENVKRRISRFVGGGQKFHHSLYR